MRWLRTALSLRAKITATFTLIVVGGTVVSTLIGSRIITDALLNQARQRGRQGLEAVQAIYRDEAGQVRDAIVRASTSAGMRLALGSGSRETIAGALAQARDAADLRFLSYVDARGQVVHAGNPTPSGVPAALDRPIRAALQGETVTSTEVLDSASLRTESASLAEQAVVQVLAERGADAGDRPAVTDGLVMISAVPITARGRVTGVIYGGLLKNNHHDIVDHVERLLYGRERHENREIGTVAVALGDVWVSTNMVGPGDERATGTVLAPGIAQTVLNEGQPWSGRTLVGGRPYEASVQPIRNHEGQAVGALYVAILSTPFLAARTEIMLTFLVVCLVGLLIVFALTYALTRTMIHPLEEMVAATKRIASGDLDVTVKVKSRDEIGELAGSFNNMLASLKRVNSELQESARTLEAKVRDRTAELVSVQARMARSEKLASIGRLAAGVAHGLNNPLGGILSLTMLALEDMPPEHPLRSDMDTVVTQTLRCREIVKGLLDFSRQSDTRTTRADINPIVESTLGLVGRQASFDNIEVVCRLEEHLPPVLIDPGQLQEVMVNLVINAADAMERHGQLTVQTSVDETAREVVLRVSDTGKGIPPEVLPLLFEPFFTTKRVGEGTGLGLAIAHGIVTRAGGRIDVTSQPGATTFTVTVPIAEEGEPNGAATLAGPGAGEPARR